MTFPSKILIIRHAEKPNDDDDIHLSSKGRHRAVALATLFSSATNHGRFPTINFIFAAGQSRHSNRSFETVSPLAEVLKLEIDTEHQDDEFKSLSSGVFSDGRYAKAVILICWHHGTIPELTRSLGASTKQLPSKKWADGTFDKIWVLDYGPKGLAGIHSEAQGVSV